MAIIAKRIQYKLLLIFSLFVLLSACYSSDDKYYLNNRYFESEIDDINTAGFSILTQGFKSFKFLALHYGSSDKPYKLNVFVNSNNKQYHSFHITKARINFDGGDVIELPRKSFYYKPYIEDYYKAHSQGGVTIPRIDIDDTSFRVIDNGEEAQFKVNIYYFEAINRYEGGNIEIEGYLEGDNYNNKLKIKSDFSFYHDTDFYVGKRN